MERRHLLERLFLSFGIHPGEEKRGEEVRGVILLVVYCLLFVVCCLLFVVCLKYRSIPMVFNWPRSFLVSNMSDTVLN